MAWYRDGTVRVTNGSATVTGTGTLWGDNKQGIGPGQMLLVPAAGTVQVYEILRVDSNTQLTLKDNFVGATASASVYAIPSFYTDSVPDFARRLSAQLSYYQSQMDGWQQIMTGTGSVTLTTPNGQTVTISSFKKLTDDMAGKASLVSGAVPVAQGGTGATTAVDARANLGLVIGTGAGQIPDMSSFVSSNADRAGYMKLPGGTIIQWGYSASGRLGSPIDTAFPIPFTSLAYSVVVSSDNAAPGSAIVVNGTTQRLTPSVFRLMNHTNDTGYTLFWIAIGR